MVLSSHSLSTNSSSAGATGLSSGGVGEFASASGPGGSAAAGVKAAGSASWFERLSAVLLTEQRTKRPRVVAGPLKEQL